MPTGIGAFYIVCCTVFTLTNFSIGAIVELDIHGETQDGSKMGGSRLAGRRIKIQAHQGVPRYGVVKERN